MRDPDARRSFSRHKSRLYLDNGQSSRPRGVCYEEVLGHVGALYALKGHSVTIESIVRVFRITNYSIRVLQPRGGSRHGVAVPLQLTRHLLTYPPLVR